MSNQWPKAAEALHRLMLARAPSLACANGQSHVEAQLTVCWFGALRSHSALPALEWDCGRSAAGAAAGLWTGRALPTAALIEWVGRVSALRLQEGARQRLQWRWWCACVTNVVSGGEQREAE